MARLSERLELAQQALSRLEEALLLTQPTLLERDAGIQRFEFTFEALWKAARCFLVELEGVDAASPKGVVRSCRELGIFNEAETMVALGMVDDRNLTVHTYNEPLAEEIYSRLPQYFSLMTKWLQIMQNRSHAL